jgi:hypothetical protein
MAPVRFRQLDLGIGYFSCWVIADRIAGRVECTEPGQHQFVPVFRRRRLSQGAQLRLQAGAFANVNLADETVLRFAGPLKVSFSYGSCAQCDNGKVFQMTSSEWWRCVEMIFGRQFRYMEMPGTRTQQGFPIGARG